MISSHQVQALQLSLYAATCIEQPGRLPLPTLPAPGYGPLR